MERMKAPKLKLRNKYILEVSPEIHVSRTMPEYEDIDWTDSVQLVIQGKSITMTLEEAIDLSDGIKTLLALRGPGKRP